MKYNNIIQGRFVSRPNRFIATVEIEGKIQTVHVKNTGRCRELLVPGCSVYLSVSDNPLRKTKYDLIAVIKNTDNGSILVNMDSQIPNFAAEEFLPLSGIFSADAKIRREVKFGNSRFDIFVEDKDRRAFIEVKGVTLEKNGVALFPDAPTERGVKHINELVEAKRQGFEAYIFFVIQMKNISSFSPNAEMHKDFAVALKNAKENGVTILAFDCIVTPDSITVDKSVDVIL